MKKFFFGVFLLLVTFTSGCGDKIIDKGPWIEYHDYAENTLIINIYESGKAEITTPSTSNNPTTSDGFISTETKAVFLGESDVLALEKLTSEQNFEQYKLDALDHPGGSVFMKIRDPSSNHYIEVYFSEVDQGFMGKTAALLAKVRSIDQQ